VVLEGNDPEHGAFFTEVAEKGFPVPPPLVQDAEVATSFSLEMDKMLKSKKETPETFIQKLTGILTGE
jgi:multiple sugar transport system substrate-binding protein